MWKVRQLYGCHCLCFLRKCVYRLTCRGSKASYIGSTIRELHTRVREHLSRDKSLVYQHCQLSWDTFEVHKESGHEVPPLRRIYRNKGGCIRKQPWEWMWWTVSFDLLIRLSGVLSEILTFGLFLSIPLFLPLPAQWGPFTSTPFKLQAVCTALLLRYCILFVRQTIDLLKFKPLGLLNFCIFSILANCLICSALH